jgi:type II secretory pathway pseudopilin PulG
MNHTQRAFTSVELLIAIGWLTIIALSLYFTVTQYISRTHDTDRFIGAKTINDAIRMYHVDHERYPSFPTELLAMDGFTHQCGDRVHDGWFTWEQTLSPIVLQYTKRDPWDQVGVFPYCYMYRSGWYTSCPNAIGYVLMFATERVQKKLGDTALVNDGNLSLNRHCFTGN